MKKCSPVEKHLLEIPPWGSRPSRKPDRRGPLPNWGFSSESYLHVYMHTRVYVYVYICIHVHAYYTCMHLYMYTCTHVSIYTYVLATKTVNHARAQLRPVIRRLAWAGRLASCPAGWRAGWPASQLARGGPPKKTFFG